MSPKSSLFMVLVYKKSQITINVLRHGCCSVPKSCPTLQPHRLQHARPICRPPFSWSLFKFRSIESMMLSNHLILCHLVLILPSVFPSIRMFFNEPSLCIRWPKYWSFSISLSSEYSWLISFRLTGFISLLSKGLSRVFYSTTV